MSATAHAGKLQGRVPASPVARSGSAGPWFRFLRAAFFALLVSGASSAEARNRVAAFFDHAEIQFESQAQGNVIQAALTDLLNRPAAVWRRLRYPDYTGARNRWSALQVISHYFVPSTPIALDENTFDSEIGAPETKREIRIQLLRLKQMMKYF